MKQYAAKLLDSAQKLFDYFESTEDIVERESPDELSDEFRKYVHDSIDRAMVKKNAHVSMTWNKPMKREYEGLGIDNPVTLTVTGPFEVPGGAR